jgi:hypothetical protein
MFNDLSKLGLAGVTIVPGAVIPAGATDAIQTVGSIATGWQPPSDWPLLTDCALGNIELIVNDQTMATYAFICTTSAGNYQINWGDGNTIQYASGAIAQHTYVIGSGTPCSLGYTTFKITISPISGHLTTFAVTSHSLATNIQYHAILSAYIRATSLTSLACAFNPSSQRVFCYQLESCIVSDVLPSCTNASNMFQSCYALQSVNVSGMTAVTNTTYMFQGCYSLQSVNVSGMTAVTNTTYMFQGCYSLQSVNVSGMTAVTNTTYMFQGCYSLQSVNVSGMTAVIIATYMFQSCLSLQSVNVSGMTAVTNTTRMFQSCYALQSVNVSGMTAVTNATQMFTYCYSLQSVNVSGMTGVNTATSMFQDCFSLQSVTATNFASAASSLSAGSMFLVCEQLINILLPNAKVTQLGLMGQSGKLDNLATISFSPLSTFSGTAPQLDVSYTTLTAAQLNAIFAQLPNNMAKTINITGCTGETLVTHPVTGTGLAPTITTVPMTTTTGLTAGMEIVGTGLNTPPPATATIATSLINSAAHGIPNGTLVYFTSVGAVTGITINTSYFVVNGAANTFQVSLTSGGAAITFGGTGSVVTMYYGNVIQTVNAGVSVVVLIPASVTGSPSTTSSTCLHSLATGKGWTITG